MALTDNGYMNRLKCVQEYPAVGSTCFMTTKVDFEAVAGLDTGDFNDTAHLIEDYCLKQQARAKRVVWTPFATICQHRDYGSDKDPIGNEYLQGIDVEKTVLSRWETEFSREPAFNPNLSLYEATMLPELKLLTDIDNRFKLKPRVMVYPFNQGAIGYYRVLSPIHELARQGLIEVIHMPTYENRDVKTHMPNLYELNRWKPDVILMHLMLQDDHYDFLCDVKENTNIKLVFGIDDFIIQLPKKSSVRREFAKDLRHRLRRTLKLCDRLLVSTPPLAEAYKDYHADIVIVPNSLSNELWGDVILTYGERKSTKPRVGWVGGSMHHGDLEVIFDTVIATHEQIDWVFMGMCPDEIKPYVAETYDVVALSDYPTTMATLDLDLALAPLEVHPFNACKSNLRLLEYGMMGWPVICSDIEPFRENNPPVTYVEENTAQAWKVAVLDALTDIERLQQEGYLLKQWVRSNYLLEQHLSSWLQAIDVK
jgi:glycosyltransferase involved in cell wall biosynthesis